MKCEIDIDLGALADEWEPVAFRPVDARESYVSFKSGFATIRTEVHSFSEHMLIVRRRWKWPEWLTAEWIFCNCHETWFATNSDPIQVNTGFQSVNAVAITTNNYFQFTPPHCTDWTKSKRRNPNAKATT